MWFEIIQPYLVRGQICTFIYRYRLGKECSAEVNHLESVVEKESPLRETEGLESHFYDAVDIHQSVDPELILLC